MAQKRSVPTPKHVATKDDYLIAVQPLIDKLKHEFPGNTFRISDTWADFTDEHGNKVSYQYVDLVQEGGGVLGIALAGYTYVLEKMGVSFMNMAGTSAGAINTLLLSTTYNKYEAHQLGLTGTYYETRSEKLLDHLATYDLGNLVDGQPEWRNFILKTFSGNGGLGNLSSVFKKLKLPLIISALAITALLFSAGAWYFANPTEMHQPYSVYSISSNLSIILLSCIALVLAFWAGNVIYSRQLTRHAAKLGINPGKAFEDWIDGILKKENINDVADFKRALQYEQDNLGYYYCKPDPDAEQSELPPINNIEKIIRDMADYNVPIQSVIAYLVKGLDEMPEEYSKAKQLEKVITKLTNAYQVRKQTEAENASVAGPQVSTIETKLAINKDIYKNLVLEGNKPYKSAGSYTKEIVLVTSDIGNEIKVEFPAMHEMYWGKDESVSPAKYVRASMSVPIFFDVMKVEYNEQEIGNIQRAWEQYTGQPKELKSFAQFVDGGMLSNFPINVFNDPRIPIPRKPTLGIKLEYQDDTQSGTVGKITELAGDILSTMRYYFDRDFLIKNQVYSKAVRSIDNGSIFWLNFNLSDKDQAELFYRGALSATIFLLRSKYPADMTKEDFYREMKEVLEMGTKVPFPYNPTTNAFDSTRANSSTATFSIFKTDINEFKQEDFKIPDIGFNWKEFKKERLRSVVMEPFRKKKVTQSASGDSEPKDAIKAPNPVIRHSQIQ